ncbi:uncharacterized protein LOC111716458 [Eurytemora carolleeae]|uniref:uncharacterized protein LOC111716458 n=1 Tax=Eurytemora carolleeae TaxID=1294199 RepID=UPI000C763D84|nr:uncharacterized protein LOC111716458 [Eurytemora carolleeae]|eukprot:XP_023347681.1 uncharacterized protein LOC111716458 [Eurytemora affinis]
MLFWSQDQVTFLSDDHPRTVVCGQFGCGKTLMVLEKLRRCLRRVEKKNEEMCEDNEEVSVENSRALFISCLSPSLKYSRDESGKYIEPIFDTSIRVALDEMAQTEGCEIHFENAESVCEKMNVRLSRSNFYSKLPEFIAKEMEKKYGIIVIDEYGDQAPTKQELKDGKWYKYLDPENQRLLNLDYLSALPLDSLVIALHPQLFEVNTSRPIDGLFKENSFQVCSLNTLYRNCASIVNYYKDIGFTDLDSCIPVTVEGIPPILIPGQFDQNIVYQTALKKITNNKFENLTNNKFVCIYEEKFKREIFLQELSKKNVDLFEIKNLNEFLAAERGCLLVQYQHIRGTESTSVLFFADDVYNASVRSLRASVELVVCVPEDSVEVVDRGPGVRRIYGLRGSPAPFRTLRDILSKENIKKTVCCFDETFTSSYLEMFKQEFQQLSLQEYPKSADELDEQLKGLKEGIIMYTQTNNRQRNKLFSLIDKTTTMFIYVWCSRYAVHIQLHHEPRPAIKQTRYRHYSLD